jgi:hypothetical protein
MPNIFFLPYFWNCFLFVLCTAGAKSFLAFFFFQNFPSANKKSPPPPPPAPGRNDDYRLFLFTATKTSASYLVFIREYRMVYSIEDQAFTYMIWLIPFPLPLLSRQQAALFLSHPMCRRSTTTVDFFSHSLRLRLQPHFWCVSESIE